MENWGKYQGIVSNVGRVCSHCGKTMQEGYVIDGGKAYYCSDSCMNHHLTKEEYLERYEDGGDSYWTQWED